ncbi:MAG: hypothetical protein KDI88_05810 [Gammaproteobacteria bacterium]|nr:hypothetical protein [Gammaproteobacteria bacterium]
MQALIRFFFELALLRRAPQDLPASPALLVLFALGGIVIGALNGREIFGGIREAGGANVLDLLLTMVMLFVLLQFKGNAERWQQTTTAFLGVGLLAGVAMLVIGALSDSLNVPELAVFADLVLAIWLHIALGHVLRHALDIPLMAGVVIVLAYTMMAFNLIIQVFPVVANA